MQDYLAMGGYAAFIWPAYGLTVLALIGILWSSLATLRAAERRAARFEAARPRRRARRDA
jgi:heme exporter protein D